MRRYYVLFIAFVVLMFGSMVNKSTYFTPVVADEVDDKGECKCPKACKCGHCLGKGVKCKCGHK
ncbi:MAG: hypothetical protein QG591_2983 [Planctomycetota bacterium]|jgi:hypothetical protein|nr:hypothetical protein [Planctomycetota bacterium]